MIRTTIVELRPSTDVVFYTTPDSIQNSVDAVRLAAGVTHTSELSTDGKKKTLKIEYSDQFFVQGEHDIIKDLLRQDLLNRLKYNAQHDIKYLSSFEYFE